MNSPFYKFTVLNCLGLIFLRLDMPMTAAAVIAVAFVVMIVDLRKDN